MEVLVYLYLFLYFVAVVLPELLAVIGFFVLLIRFHSMTGLALKLFILLVLYFLLRGDAIVGEFRIRNICNQPAEYFRTIYKTVELDRSYWDGSGWPIFHKKDNKEFDPSVFNERYQLFTRLTPLDNRFIDKSTRATLKDKITGETLFTHDIYSSTRGWYAERVDGHFFYGRRCGEESRYDTNLVPGVSYAHHITGWVFLPNEPLE